MKVTSAIIPCGKQVKSIFYGIVRSSTGLPKSEAEKCPAMHVHIAKVHPLCAKDNTAPGGVILKMLHNAYKMAINATVPHKRILVKEIQIMAEHSITRTVFLWYKV